MGYTVSNLVGSWIHSNTYGPSGRFWPSSPPSVSSSMSSAALSKAVPAAGEKFLNELGQLATRGMLDEGGVVFLSMILKGLSKSSTSSFVVSRRLKSAAEVPRMKLVLFISIGDHSGCQDLLTLRCRTLRRTRSCSREHHRSAASQRTRSERAPSSCGRKTQKRTG